MKTLGLIAMTAIFVVAALHVQTNIFVRHQSSSEKILDSKVRLDYSWAQLPWTGDDAPYRRARNNIQAAIAKGQTPANLLDMYKSAAQSEPNNSVSQFAWADAAWEYANSDVSDSEGMNALCGVPEALATVPFPRCYDFVRLRFLVEFANPSLADLGERLLQSVPNDDQVKYKLLKIYSVVLANKAVPDDMQKRRAVKYANDLIHAHPEKASNYASLASIYLALWERDHSKSNGAKAVASYQKYLYLASPSAEFRPMAENLIHLIQKG